MTYAELNQKLYEEISKNPMDLIRVRELLAQDMDETEFHPVVLNGRPKPVLTLL